MLPHCDASPDSAARDLSRAAVALACDDRAELADVVGPGSVYDPAVGATVVVPEEVPLGAYVLRRIVDRHGPVSEVHFDRAVAAHPYAMWPQHLRTLLRRGAVAVDEVGGGAALCPAIAGRAFHGSLDEVTSAAAVFDLDAFDRGLEDGMADAPATATRLLGQLAAPRAHAALSAALGIAGIRIGDDGSVVAASGAPGRWMALRRTILDVLGDGPAPAWARSVGETATAEEVSAVLTGLVALGRVTVTGTGDAARFRRVRALAPAGH